MSRRPEAAKATFQQRTPALPEGPLAPDESPQLTARTFGYSSAPGCSSKVSEFCGYSAF